MRLLVNEHDEYTKHCVTRSGLSPVDLDSEASLEVVISASDGTSSTSQCHVDYSETAFGQGFRLHQVGRWVMLDANCIAGLCLWI